jgi:hypothetical protein
MENLDTAIINEYVHFNTPADQIVTDLGKAKLFWAGVAKRMGTGSDDVDLAALNKKLLNMRRRGEDNGGLPRLRREFRGRGSKPR